jgi:AbrB family looped-hinge helix DNA binding protein
MEGCSSKISSQYQITLPGEVRKKLGVGPGDKVVFVEEDNKIVIVSLKDLIYEMVESFKGFEETEGEFRKGFRFREGID